MRDPLEKYVPGISFWKVMPQLQDVKPFRELYEDDKSEGKLYSSLVMWWVVRVSHLTNLNVLRDMLVEERRTKASEALFDDPKWHKEKKKEAELRKYEAGWDLMKPLALRNLETARAQMEARNAYLASMTKAYKVNRDEIEKMALKTPELLRNITVLEGLVREAMGEEDEDEDEDESAMEGNIL